jgi:hypothetical protein
MLDHLGEHRMAPPRDDVIQLSDGRLDRFSFCPPNPTPVREASVEYQNYSDDSAKLILETVDQFLPRQYRFIKKYPKGPNKALEPTPTAVTSPAAQEPRQP